MESENLCEFEKRRDELGTMLGEVGDLRPGSLVRRTRRCGKPRCHCARPDDPGHQDWILTREVGGKTVTKSIPKRAVETTRQQVAEYRRFRELSQQFVQASEALCQARLSTATAEAKATAKKGASRKSSTRRSSGKSKR